MIRPARPDDVPEILSMVGELADYHDEPDAVVSTPGQLHDALFGADPTVFAQVASETGDDGAETIVGMAVYIRNFSTWSGTHGIWLEDLYVRPTSRGGGHGKLLLAALAKMCRDEGYKRLEWAVADANTSAIGFYRSIGAKPMEDWTTHRLSGDALSTLAAEA